MSIQPTSPDPGARLVDACRAHGLPVTVQRREVFSALVPRTDHPTADDIYETVRARLAGISRATVYRVLETLVRVGVARKVPHPGTAARFDPIMEPHQHFHCETCGCLSDVSWLPDAWTQLLPTADACSGNHLREVTVLFTGTCQACASGGRSRPRRAARPRR